MLCLLFRLVAGVAPHAGSVDRNMLYDTSALMKCVAPHAGSVDRNIPGLTKKSGNDGSLPTRGAWIEIRERGHNAFSCDVAPHAGSVDRNTLHPSSVLYGQAVAPHAGSVDRNLLWLPPLPHWLLSLPTRGAWIEMAFVGTAENGYTSRSPRGERG